MSKYISYLMGIRGFPNVALVNGIKKSYIIKSKEYES